MWPLYYQHILASDIRYVRTKWVVPNKCCGIFFVHWFDQGHQSITASKEIWSGLIRICRTQWRCFFICFRLETPYLGKFSLKKWKLSVSAEIWYIVWLKYEDLSGDVHSFYFLTILLFMANLFQKIKIVCWSWNLERRLIWICKIRCWCSFILF